MLKTKDKTPAEHWLDQPLLAAVNLDWEKALYALFIALAVLSRLWDLGARVMSHDETVHIQWSWYLFQGRGYAHTPLSHGPFLFHATALSYYLFGDNDFSARLVVALMGIALVALPYWFRRWLGRGGALATSFLFLISPSLLYYSRYIRHDIPVIVWSLIAIAAIFRYLEEQRERWLLILAAALSLMFATKEVAFIYVAILGLFLVFMFFIRLGTPRWEDPAWELWSKRLLWIAAGSLLVMTLAFGLVGIAEGASPQDTESAAPSAELVVSSEPSTVETNPFVNLFRFFTRLGAIGAVVALASYAGLLALGSPSHRRIILAILGLVMVIMVTMTLLLFSLNLVELFPIRHRDCGQAPVPGSVPGEMRCTEADCALIQGRCQRAIPVIASDTVIEFDETGTRVAVQLSRIEIFFTVMLIGVFALAAGGGTYLVMKNLMPFRRGEHRTFDLIIFIGSFILTFTAPLAINVLSRIVSRLFFGIDAAFSALDYSEAGLLRSAGFVFILLATSIVVGLSWDWKRWLSAATIFYIIFVVLFTTIFTNGNGLASGSVGSLSYWLEQQDVQRGGQPTYYYALLVPLYEYLPLIGFIAAVVFVLARSPIPRKKDSTENSQGSISHMHPAALWATSSLEAAFVIFLLFWNVLTWLAYSYAGEKMPWLTSHFAVPLAMTTGWIVNRLISGVDWRTILRRGGWVVVLIVPVGFAALVQTISPWLTAPPNSRPFSGYGLGQLNTTMQFLSALVMLAACIGVLYWAWQRISPSALGRLLAVLALAVLTILTIRTAWLFAFVNYDYASEYMVYAHSTPDVREVMEQIEDISRRTAGELSLDIAYTADGSYPFIWYLRNYPNAFQLPNPPSRPDLEKSIIIAGDKEWSGIEPYLGDNYTCNRYNFLWWPMQDYYGLTWERIRYALTNPEMRAALWDIIFRRDFQKYEQATGKTVRLSEWPLRDSFRFCIRRDVIARVWSESSGPIEFVAETVDVSPTLPDYSSLELPAAADLVVSALGAPGNFNSPHDIALDTNGFVYVVDSNNHRVVKLSPDGQVVDTWDSTWWHGLQNWKPGCLDASDRPLALGDGEFCEPWGITVGSDGRVYVADTWNHRVQVFTTEGEFLGKFGAFGQSGSSISSSPSQFYGPRDVVVDEQGYIYVSDTGNKRIQVFAPDFSYQRSFGGPGIIEGRMEEPVGLALGSDNLIYVADTWNNRVQALTLEGTFVREWPVLGWKSQSVVNKPYIATDSAGRVYVSDPEGPRVIVYDAEGMPLAVLGGPGSTLFQLPTGVILDEQNRLWISDATSQRLLRFPALNLAQEQGQP